MKEIGGVIMQGGHNRIKDKVEDFPFIRTTDKNIKELLKEGDKLKEFVLIKANRQVIILKPFNVCNRGTRFYFICTKCSRKIEKLYLKNNVLNCKECHGLNFTSTSVNPYQKEIQKWIRRKNKLMKKYHLDENLLRPSWMSYEMWKKTLKTYKKYCREEKNARMKREQTG
jgi:hypothetical protein